MNKWERIRDFYRQRQAAILAEKPNEWAMDPYEWHDVVEMTPIENWLWHDIRAVDLVLYPQLPVGRFFVDFGNPVAGVAIECDGAAWHLDKEKDAARDAEIARLGWMVYRISGSDCRKDYDEETRTKSPGRLLAERIGQLHPIRRNSGGHCTGKQVKWGIL